MRTTRSDLDRVQRIAVERGTRACNWCKRWHPLAPGRIYGKKKSSLWVYVPPSISQLTTNDWPLFENKTRDIFLLRCVFVHSLKFVNYVWLCFHLYLYESIQHFYHYDLRLRTGMLKILCNLYNTYCKNLQTQIRFIVKLSISISLFSFSNQYNLNKVLTSRDLAAL